MTPEERLALCKACPHFAMGLREKCGCVMALKVKIPSSQCPIGKW